MVVAARGQRPSVAVAQELIRRSGDSGGRGVLGQSLCQGWAGGLPADGAAFLLEPHQAAGGVEVGQEPGYECSGMDDEDLLAGCGGEHKRRTRGDAAHTASRGSQRDGAATIDSVPAEVGEAHPAGDVLDRSRRSRRRG